MDAGNETSGEIEMSKRRGNLPARKSVGPGVGDQNRGVERKLGSVAFGNVPGTRTGKGLKNDLGGTQARV